jgi:hypothetical protein
MLSKNTLSALLIILATSLFGQSQELTLLHRKFPIRAYETEIISLAFEKGDIVSFNFKVDKRNLSEIDIIMYPNSVIRSDFKTKQYKGEVTIRKTGVYQFVLKNETITKRIVNAEISRIPNSEGGMEFNSVVAWNDVYDTITYSEIEDVLVKVDTAYHTVLDQNLTVHSTLSMEGNVETVTFSLPKNTVAWSYFLGVNQQGEQAYLDAQNSMTGDIVSVIGFADPLIASLITGVSTIASSSNGEDIKFWIGDFMGGQATNYFKNGQVISDNSNFEGTRKGLLGFTFQNENQVTGVKVDLKVSAISASPIYEKQKVIKQRVDYRSVPSY